MTNEKARREYKVELSALFQEAAVDLPEIWIDPERMAGAPCIKGTRIPVFCVLRSIITHGSIQGVMKDYPQLNPDQVVDALYFAMHVIECPLPVEPIDAT